jgi:GxxExxY protein
MNADKRSFKHSEVTRRIISVFFQVYNELGHGFLESVYAKSLQIALVSLGIKAHLKIEVPVSFRGKNVGTFEADMLVENCVLVELKAVRALDKAHEAQLLNYLRATEIEAGLLLNFGLEPQFQRMAFDNSRKVVGRKCLSITELLNPEPTDKSEED